MAEAATLEPPFWTEAPEEDSGPKDAPPLPRVSHLDMLRTKNATLEHRLVVANLEHNHATREVLLLQLAEADRRMAVLRQELSDTYGVDLTLHVIREDGQVVPRP